MKQHILLGRLGEEKALSYLIKKGYEIVEQNFSCKTGELDIVARKGNTLIAVEVKTRRSLAYGFPCESINRSKIERIIKTLKYYVLINKLENLDLRIDAIEILVTDKGNYIKHIENIT